MGKAMIRIMTVVIVIAVILSGIGTALAQQKSTVNETDISVLEVNTPATVEAGIPFTLTVTERGNGTPVNDASVYALVWPNRNVRGYFGYMLYATCKYVFLGKTTNGGSIEYTFNDPGSVLIIATKEQWGPGLARLTVKPKLEGKLAINCPTRVLHDEPFTVEVVKRWSGEPVAGADIWLVRPPVIWIGVDYDRCISEMKRIMEDLMGYDDNNDGNISEKIASTGEYLGETDSEGEFEYIFDHEGIHILAATKSDYVPGFKVIAAVENMALDIKADPGIADIGDDVSFNARNRGTSAPVGGVDLYILKPGWVSTGIINLKETGTYGKRLEQMAVDDGEYIGTTDDNGEYTHQFEEKGMYLVIGKKDDYRTGLTTVCIGESGRLRQINPMPGIPQLKERLIPKLDWPNMPGWEKYRGLHRLSHLCGY